MGRIFNRETLIKNVLSIVMFALIMILEGCWNFFDLSWDFSKMQTTSFWGDIIVYTILLYLVRCLSLSIFLDFVREKNQELAHEKKRNKSLMKLKEPDFFSWVDNNENKEIKIEKWKAKVNKKLAKLEKKAKASDKTIFYGDDENLKKINKYCIKKNELLQQLDFEWILKNFDILPLRSYPRINAAVFDVPVNESKYKSNKNFQVESKMKSAIFYSLLIAGIFMAFSRIIKNTIDQFILSNDMLLQVIINIVFDLIFILWQFFNGILDAFRIVNTEELIPYINRNRILEKYIYFKRPNEKSKIDQMLELIDKNSKEK